MRKLLLVLGIVALQGCATTPAGNGNLAALPLFGADSSAEFAFYFACAGNSDDSTFQCETVRRAFDAWSEDRHIASHRVGMDDPVFRSGRPADAGLAADKPYLLAVRFEPIVTPGYQTWSGTAGTMSSGFVPGRVGYDAKLIVFSTATGAVVKTLSPHHQQAMPQHTDVTPTMKADVHDLIALVDPAYSHH